MIKSTKSWEFIPKTANFISSGFFSGYSPISPGTCGSLVALFVWMLMPRLDGVFALIPSALLGIIGYISCLISMKGMNPTEDPQWIVIDEWCGMWITLAFCRTNLWSGQVNEQKDLIPIIAAFILFRFFDITKLGPIGWAESFHGAVGVMLDDVVAGICALCSLSLLRVLFNF